MLVAGFTAALVYCNLELSSMENKYSLFNQELKASYCDGSLKIECPSIKLTQNSTKDCDVIHASGVIELGAQFGMRTHFRIELKNESLPSVFRQLKRQAETRSGEIYSPDHFFSLEATDAEGNIWTNSAVYPVVQTNFFWLAIQFAAESLELSTASNLDSEYLHFAFLDDIELPPLTSQSHSGNEDVARLTHFPRDRLHCQIDETSILLGRGKCNSETNLIEIFAHRKTGPLQPMFGMHMLTAFQFCTASQSFPVISEGMIKGKRRIIFNRHKPWERGLTQPPQVKIAHEGYFHELLRCYFMYSRESEGPRHSPISRILDKIFSLNGVTYVTASLILAVTAESLTRLDFFKRVKVTDERFKDFTLRLSKAITSSPTLESYYREYAEIPSTTGSASLESRLNGLIQSMSNVRAIDVLWKLQQAGAINENEIKSWKVLRNSSAHGTLDITGEELQEYLDHMHRVTTMIYKIVFLIINYRGVYANLGQRGWDAVFFDAPAFRKNLGL